MTTRSDNLAPLAQRYIEDVRVGDQLPGFELELGWTKMAEQVSGSQDFYPVHHDPGFAAEAGPRKHLLQHRLHPGRALSCHHRLDRPRRLAAQIPLRDAPHAGARRCRADARQGD